ncbi:hypothetical protein ES319_D07G009000v1 [Gossypium barbadense]|uniref:Oxidative stress 3 n=1 Tax=Gossypium barbadense TaxID=3634 RepID=A0A5J5QKT4_GOSBA|nr:hypothetical protein ES319_D07G009000v1 [Gossypium barbadense]
MGEIFGDMKMKKMESDESSFENCINASIASSSNLVDDATTSSASSSNGPLYELSEMMAQLPIKRGLSKHYHGKSQSFTSLANVKSIEDLPKKVVRVRAKIMKSCKSYGWGLDGHHHHNKVYYSPKATISKKGSSSTRVCFMSSSLAT